MNILHINTNYLSNALHQNMINTMEKKGVSNTVFVPTYIGSPMVIKPNDNVTRAEFVKILVLDENRES